jgi:hypothetical protein
MALCGLCSMLYIAWWTRLCSWSVMKLIAYLLLGLLIVSSEAAPNPGVWGTQRHVCNPNVETLTLSREHETLTSLTT